MSLASKWHIFMFVDLGGGGSDASASCRSQERSPLVACEEQTENTRCMRAAAVSD